MKNYNQQDDMYCFIVLFCPLFNLFNLSTTILAYSHWFRNFNSVQCATDNEV